MEKELAEKIVAENPDEYKIHEDYSGRFMYGETTVAVRVPDRSDVGYIQTKYDVDNWDNLALDYLVY